MTTWRNYVLVIQFYYRYSEISRIRESNRIWKKPVPAFHPAPNILVSKEGLRFSIGEICIFLLHVILVK
jgi:hypothetical protein